MSIEPDDWRLTNQMTYLKGVTLRRKRYTKYSENWDHDHCSFCWVEFCEEDSTPEHPAIHEGYATDDDYYWICDTCFTDFRELFQW